MDELAETIQCPYCFSTFEIMMDGAGGARQSFVYDCEICCRPILIKAVIHGNEVILEVERES
ncbi:MAG: CPXCG motif-containing cysteine-rich protein [Chlamydiae bacterium]|nr:CPXCG motif-containing cysteine-rich protein [Chlamydiota bacterium]MBI3265614.1 CPXCG motif-containing cysteine-rich protein [Chlamydiota bacterium]